MQRNSKTIERNTIRNEFKKRTLTLRVVFISTLRTLQIGLLILITTSIYLASTITPSDNSTINKRNLLIFFSLVSLACQKITLFTKKRAVLYDIINSLYWLVFYIPLDFIKLDDNKNNDLRVIKTITGTPENTLPTNDDNNNNSRFVSVCYGIMNIGSLILCLSYVFLIIHNMSFSRNKQQINDMIFIQKFKLPAKLETELVKYANIKGNNKRNSILLGSGCNSSTNNNNNNNNNSNDSQNSNCGNILSLQLTASIISYIILGYHIVKSNGLVDTENTETLVWTSFASGVIGLISFIFKRHAKGIFKFLIAVLLFIQINIVLVCIQDIIKLFNDTDQLAFYLGLSELLICFGFLVSICDYLLSLQKWLRQNKEREIALDMETL